MLAIVRGSRILIDANSDIALNWSVCAHLMHHGWTAWDERGRDLNVFPLLVAVTLGHGAICFIM